MSSSSSSSWWSSFLFARKLSSALQINADTSYESMEGTVVEVHPRVGLIRVRVRVRVRPAGELLRQRQHGVHKLFTSAREKNTKHALQIQIIQMWINLS